MSGLRNFVPGKRLKDNMATGTGLPFSEDVVASAPVLPVPMPVAATAAPLPGISASAMYHARKKAIVEECMGKGRCIG